MADFARSDDPAVQAQLDRLGPVSGAGDRLGLERIRELLDRLGRPQDRLPPVFHVAGTNGKGSVCAFLRAGLEAAGHRVHVFTSPHLVRFNERIRVSGQLIGDTELAALLKECIDAADGLDVSFFEVATAAAFLAFSTHPAEALVLEVGLGGRLDATNVIDRPAVCGIASLGMDHAQFLGSTLSDIAREKAGIAKRGLPLVVADYDPEISDVVARGAIVAGAELFPAFRRWHYGVAGDRLQYRDAAGALMVPLPEMHGLHQIDNCALALAMLRHQEAVDVPLAALKRMPLEAHWPARLQRLKPGRLTGTREVWLDGGHNPAAAVAVASFVEEQWLDSAPPQLIFACLKSKDPRAILERFAGLVGAVHTVPIEWHDCYSPEELASLARELGFEATPHSSVEAAIAATAQDARLLIFGSLYLAGQVLAANGQAPA